MSGKGSATTHRTVSRTRCVTNVKFSGMNLNVIRSVTRPLNTFCSAPRNMTGTLLLPCMVRCGTRSPTTSGCVQVTRTVKMSARNVARTRNMGTTVRTMGTLSLDVGVPRGLRRVGIGRRSVPTLTMTTFGSMYAKKGPHPASMRSVRTLCHGTFWD